MRLVAACFAVCGLSLFAGCALRSRLSADQKPTAYARSDSLSVPHSDSFARDRDLTCGFDTPRLAAAVFMRTLFSDENPALLHDQASKRRFFSATLRRQIALSLKQASSWKQGWADYRTHPGIRDKFNKRVFQAWDTPSSFRLAAQHTTGDRAIVDVIYHWGPGRQYAGVNRLTSVILVKESGRWFIDDLYTHEGMFFSAVSFKDRLVW